MKDTLPEKVQEQIVNKLLSRGANARCADCLAKSPCWISMDFGVFICLNCSGQHRNLGPHITRVRSIKLDKWTTEIAQTMDALGNDIAAAYYEAKMTSNFGRPDPNGGTPERTKQFIAQKYINKVWAREGPTPYQILSKGGNPSEIMTAVPTQTKGPAPEAPKPQAAPIDLLDIGSAPVITDHKSRTTTQQNQDLLSFDPVETTGSGGRRKSNRTSNSTGHSAEQQAEETKAHQHQLNHHAPPVTAPKNDAFNFIKPKESTTSTAAAMKQVYQMPMFDLTAQPAKQQVVEKVPELAHFNSNPLPGQMPAKPKPAGSILDLYNNVEIKDPTLMNEPADAKKGTLQRGNYAFLDSMGGRPPQPQNNFNPMNQMGQRPPVHPGTQMPSGFVPGFGVNNYGAGNSMMTAGKGPI